MTAAGPAIWHVIVIGRVQGVGFRWYARERARSLDLTGWVRNRPDGSVEILASGASSRLEEFKALIREGPRGATVDDTRELATDAEGTGDSFEIIR